ncbi:hypothetical protein HNR03_000197 [Pseudomonas sp. JAI111]|nr:hypothetical protein [Pseudomonas sp. JAI111]
MQEPVEELVSIPHNGTFVPMTSASKPTPAGFLLPAGRQKGGG